jgi:hypothetical protein
MSRTRGHSGRWAHRELWAPRPNHRRHGAAMCDAKKPGRKMVIQAERIQRHREEYALVVGAVDPDCVSPAWVAMGGPNANG